MLNAFPPGPKSFLPSGALRALQRDPIGFLTRMARTYGDVSHWHFGPQHFYFFNHPDLIREVLVTSARSFMKGRALQRAKIFLGDGLLTSEGDTGRGPQVAGRGGGGPRPATRDPFQQFDVAHEMMRLTLSIVGRTLFDAEVEQEANEVGRALTDLMDLFTVLLSPFAGILQRLPLPSTRRFRRAMRRLDATIYRIIEERRAAGDRGDLLSMLLLAQNEEGDELACHPERSE